MMFTQETVLSALPDRDENAHKGDFGRILLLCGSRGFTGAAYLAAMGALRTGAGLVYLGVPESIYAIEAVKLNEAVVFPLPDREGMLSESAIPPLEKKLPQMHAALIGCGLGQSDGTKALVHWLLGRAECPVVLDADGINLVSGHKDILRGRTGATILTPHDGEFARLGFPLGGDRMAAAKTAARDLRCVMVLKGHRTCVTDGQREYINPTGNPGMAVGGSGDLLAGMLVSLLGQGLEPMLAAACGCWLHGKAGDVCAASLGQYGMLPTDMLEALPRLLK